MTRSELLETATALLERAELSIEVDEQIARQLAGVAAGIEQGRYDASELEALAERLGRHADERLTLLTAELAALSTMIERLRGRDDGAERARLLRMQSVRLAQLATFTRGAAAMDALRAAAGETGAS